MGCKNSKNDDVIENKKENKVNNISLQPIVPQNQQPQIHMIPNQPTQPQFHMIMPNQPQIYMMPNPQVHIMPNQQILTPLSLPLSSVSLNWKDIDFKGTTEVINAECVDVYDGDTCKFKVKKEDFLKNIPGEYIVINIRMVGINSAEIRTKDLKEKERGYQCKQHLQEKILNKQVKLKCIKHDKYGGRFDGIILPKETTLTLCDEKLFEISYNNQMLKEGYAEAYSGSGEKKWS